jgi:hypothetical protein
VLGFTLTLGQSGVVTSRISHDINLLKKGY